MWNTILFDLDGTLTDSGEGIIKSARYALEKCGVEVPDESQLRSFVGPPLLESFREYGVTGEAAQRAIGFFRERYARVGVYENRLYPGIRELLSTLKQNHYTLAVASSKLDSMVREVLRYFEIEQYFGVVVGGSQDGSLVRKTDVINETIRRLGMENMKDEIIYVGDRKHDIIGAHLSGIDAIGVLYGYGSLSELENEHADLLASSVEDLGRILFSQPQPWHHPYEMRPVLRNSSITGTERAPMKIWRCIYPALFYFVIANIVSVVGSIFLMMMFSASGNAVTYDGIYAYVMNHALLLTGIAAAVAMPFLLWLFYRDEKRRRIFGFRKGILQDSQWKIPKIFLSVLFVVAAANCISLLIDLSNIASVDSAYQQVADILNSPSLVQQILIVGILAPVTEELVFRGLVFRRLRDYLNPGWAIVISGIAFGIYHGNFVQGIFAAGVGILLALLYEKSGTILVPISAHMANNLFSTFATTAGTQTTSFEVTFYVLLTVVLAWYLFFYKRKKSYRRA